MKNMRLILVLEFSLLIILAGCGAKKPACSPESLKAPELVSPENETVAGISPSLTWSYPDPACAPEKYRVYLSSNPYFRDDIGAKTVPLGAGGLWTPAKPLASARVYKWQVSAISGGKEGPKSSTGVFYTGPMCKADELIAPTLIEPGNGDSFFTKTRYFRWIYTGSCLPERYAIQLRSYGKSGAAEEITDNAEGMGFFVRGYTEPCLKYEWRVAGMVGKTVGPYSDFFAFTEYSGTSPDQVCRDAPPAPTPYVPSPTPIEVGSTLVTAHFKDVGYCRSGPGTLYDVLTSLTTGDTVIISGRNADSTWLQVERPDGKGNCWSSVSLLEVSGDPLSLPVIVPPPLPTPAPVLGCYVLNPITQSTDCVRPCPGDAQPGGVCTP